MSLRKTNRDHAKKKHHPLIENEVITSHLQALLTPAIFNQQALYRQLGLRNRILNLPFMVAAVLTLLWRNVPGVQELTRLLHKEGFLWIEANQVTQKALSSRFLTFPAILFEKVLFLTNKEDNLTFLLFPLDKYLNCLTSHHRNNLFNSMTTGFFITRQI